MCTQKESNILLSAQQIFDIRNDTNYLQTINMFEDVFVEYQKMYNKGNINDAQDILVNAIEILSMHHKQTHQHILQNNLRNL